LLNAFYTTVDKGSFKVETKDFFPEFLDNKDKNAICQYSEFKNGIFKYCFSDVSEVFYDRCLEEHLGNKINLCCYLNPIANSLFAFNLDSYEKLDRVDECAELKAFAKILSAILLKFGVRPFIICSGHGYHFWCRLSVPVENQRLRVFMQSVLTLSKFQMTAERLDLSRLQCICYPRVNTHDVSIRLFGSKHTVTGRFCGVVKNPRGEWAACGEEESWHCFEEFINCTPVTEQQFERAQNFAIELLKLIS
jgi:hypothetical protein